MCRFFGLGEGGGEVGHFLGCKGGEVLSLALAPTVPAPFFSPLTFF